MKPICFWLASKTLDMVAGPEDFDGKLLSTYAWAMADFYYTLDEAGQILTDDELSRATRAGRLFLLTYGVLAARDLALGVVNFKLIPTHHCVDHKIINLARTRENPRWLHNYLAEDYLGKITRVIARTHRLSC